MRRSASSAPTTFARLDGRARLVVDSDTTVGDQLQIAVDSSGVAHISFQSKPSWPRAVAVPSGCVGPNNDSAYNGCTTHCTYGPFCGDGLVNGPEACDDGLQNGVAYTIGCNTGGCTSTCTLPHCCGDGVVDADDGEECDLGNANGPKSSCTADCKIEICLDPPCP